MRPDDVRGCVEIVASVSSARRIYGDAIRDLPDAWLRLLEFEAKEAVVFEEVVGASAAICAIGVSVFVNDEFVRELKARPFWFAPELARQLKRGHSPLLFDRELRQANSRGGLTALVWEGRITPGFEENAEVHRKLANIFLETHRGFLWKEVICHQIETAERLNWSPRIGGLLWDPIAGGYTDRLGENPEEFLSHPHVFGLTREIEIARPAGSWVGGLFEYQPPRFGFSRSEQHLLLAALNGGTDQELSRELDISPETVKKAWCRIYARVSACLTELIPSNFAAENGTSERGKEKKQRLLAYLRDHPEELRPASRKLLQQDRKAHAMETLP